MGYVRGWVGTYICGNGGEAGRISTSRCGGRLVCRATGQIICGRSLATRSGQKHLTIVGTDGCIASQVRVALKARTRQRSSFPVGQWSLPDRSCHDSSGQQQTSRAGVGNQYLRSPVSQYRLLFILISDRYTYLFEWLGV
jgi:hypothetical protein